MIVVTRAADDKGGRHDEKIQLQKHGDGDSRRTAGQTTHKGPVLGPDVPMMVIITPIYHASSPSSRSLMRKGGMSGSDLMQLTSETTGQGDGCT